MEHGQGPPCIFRHYKAGQDISNSLGPSGACIMKEAHLHPPQLWSTVRREDFGVATYYFSAAKTGP